MQAALERTQQDLDVQTAWKTLMRTGNFSANDMAVLVRMWAFIYFGGRDEMSIEYFDEVTGLKHYQYIQLRARLRKVGVFSWDKHTKKWLIRHPGNWLAEHVQRSAKQSANASRTGAKVRKALKQSDTIQLELV